MHQVFSCYWHQVKYIPQIYAYIPTCMLDLYLTRSKSLVNIPHHTLLIVPASHICCTLVHVYSNVIMFSCRHERRRSRWNCQSCWMHGEDIKPVWISYATHKHWMALFQTSSLAIKSTTALLKMSLLMKSNSQGHGTPSFHIQIMDTRKCVLVLRGV